MTRRLLSILAAFAAAAIGASPAPYVEIVVAPEGRRWLTAPAAEVGPVYFTDERVTVHASVTFESSSDEPGQQFVFPDRNWLDALKLRVYTQDGAEVPFTPRVLRGGPNAASDGPLKLRDRESVDAVIELVGLPPGNYRIEGSVGDVKSLKDDRSLFTVRRGNEDTDTIRLHYRYRADKVSGDFRAYERVMRELFTKYEPTNAGILVEIADWSIDKVPPEETVRYYREARSMMEAKWRSELAERPNMPDIQRRRMERAIQDLTLFERVLPYYAKHRAELRFGRTVANEDVTSYAWFERKGGRKLGTIDPVRPDAWRRTANDRK